MQEAPYFTLTQKAVRICLWTSTREVGRRRGDGLCCGLNVCASLCPSSWVEILMPNVMLLGRAFGRFLSHEGEDLTNVLKYLIKTPKRSLVPSTT